MSLPTDDNPWSNQPEDVNPFASPAEQARVPQDFHTGAEVEQVRRKYLSHEAVIRSIGFFNILCGAFKLIGAIAVIVVILSETGPRNGGRGAIDAAPGVASAIMAAMGAFLLFLAFLDVWIGIGLRTIKPGIRIASIVVTGLYTALYTFSFLAGSLMEGNGRALIPLLICIYILWAVTCSKGAYVLSPPYAEVVRQTPQIKYKTSIVVWIFLGLLVVIIAIGLLIALFAAIFG